MMIERDGYFKEMIEREMNEMNEIIE